ncbi:type VI secretion system protein ImpL [Pseudoxanthobacter soli DSM 19599]|uniref:Type VI secretion system protein ImpL n=1 Tax=Pseudoxanthobacter soli DSM 19599 TaxID=1123029 RepID=A0A1M7ZQI7_9HYPH|nr:type VI secretion system membrane subunit TssM [Pseudoxanthobacter soli]SHO67174.1 type VI secretion system protein ImpL [Pseudoxanthobacter soli DSM 19599]
MMKPLGTWAFWRLVLVAAAFLLLSLLTWFLAPLITVGGAPVIGDPVLRLLAALIVLLIGVVVVLVLLLRGFGQSARKPFQSSASNEEEAKTQTDALEAGLRRAFATLKGTGRVWRLDRSYRYKLPWYLVIGPERAGKTSLIRSSGLRFPATDSRGGHIAAGPAFTFSFVDNAVFVDTAGPFGPHSQRRLWRNFLGLLKRYRPREPINGVVIVLSVAELRTAAESQTAALFAEIRQQLIDLRNQLRASFPVYAVFTRVDDVPGFEAFFANLAPVYRNAVFGLTLPIASGRGAAANPPEAIGTVFGREYDDLLRWQTPRVLEQVNGEGDITRRFDDFMFLPQMALLKQKYLQFVEDVFRPNEFEPTLQLRGVYFTSARADLITKSDEPAETVGTPSVAVPAQRGLFIRDLFEQVVIPEAGLVALDRRARRAQRLTQWATLALIALVALALCGWWAYSFANNRTLIKTVEQRADRAKLSLAMLGANPSMQPTQNTDLAATIPALKALEDIPTGWGDTRDYSVPAFTGGLSQYGHLSGPAKSEYVDALHMLFLPQLVGYLESDIQDSMSDPAKLYGAVMVYLMFGGVRPVDKEVIANWFDRRWQSLYPNASDAPLRASLQEQLQNLLKAGFAPAPIQEQLVANARAVLNEFPPAMRGMALLKQLPEIRNLPTWRLTDVAGPLASYALVRRSGKSLAEAVPGMYTADHFSTVVLPAISKVAETVMNEDWVRFLTPEDDEGPERQKELEREMTDLYVSDYIAQWEGLLNDVTIASFTDFNSELSVLQAVLGPPSPLSLFLNSVSQQTTLSPAPESKEAAATAPQAATPLSAAAQAGQPITEHFAGLHAFVAGNPSPLDGTLQSLSQLRALIGPAASAGSSPAQVTALTSGPGFSQLLSQMQFNTLSAPPSLADAVAQITQQTSAIANEGVKSDLSGTWTSEVYPFCQAAIEGRYPFAVSENEVTIADFSRLLAPNGLLDQFFTKQIKPYVDTTRTPWRLNKAAARPNLTPAAIKFFEQADRIRKVFFVDGGATPQVSFQIEPYNLDPNAMRVTLSIDGQTLTYQYGPPQRTPIHWPGAKGGVSIAFAASTPGTPSMSNVTGPWALFRFLSTAKVTRLTATRFQVAVQLGSNSASFVIEADSVMNPFGQNPLAGFKCPPALVPG